MAPKKSPPRNRPSIRPPSPRAGLVEAALPEKLIDGIADGSYEWEIDRAPAIGVSGSEAAAQDMARAAAARKDFRLTVWRSKATQAKECPWDLSRRARRLFESTVPNEVGERIARARRYEGALADRGDAVSSLFENGSIDDWTAVEHAPSWDALAFEFRRAAEAVAATHSVEKPAPALVLLALCRHHVELALKAIIMAGDRLVGNPVNLPGTHPLTPLWDRAEALMRAAWKDGWSDEVAQAVRAVVGELDRMDRKGMATRYPVDKANAPFARPTALVNFSVAAFMKSFAVASDFLGTATLWMEVGLLAKDADARNDDEDA